MTKTNIHKITLIVTIIALVLTVTPNGIGQVQATGYSPFHDVATNHWALAHILKTELRGVISGYGNGLFKPDQTVTQLEAVVMAVRAMGLEKAADNTNNQLDTSKYDLPTSWNAKGFVSVAIKEKLVDEGTFRPNAGASRAWTAQLLIRMLGMEEEVNPTAITDFVDDAQIPVFAKRYVALAVQKGVVSGYPTTSGKYEYRPNQAVTRAELATLISRSDRYMNDVAGQLPVGVIESVTESQIVVVTGENQKTTYRLSDTLAVYNDSYNKIALSQLAISDAIRFYANSSRELAYIEKINPIYYTNLPVVEKEEAPVAETNTHKGALLQIYPEQRVIIIKKEDNTLYTATYGTNVVVRDVVQNKSVSIGDLHVGDEVTLASTSNMITRIELTKSSEEAILKGKIFALDLEQGILTIENNGRYTAYLIDDVVNVEYEGIRFATVRDLVVGDEVQLQLNKERVSKITLLKPYKVVDDRGSIVAISVKDKIITVLTSESTPIAYRVDDKTIYNIPDVVYPTIADLAVGDQVKFTIDGEVLTKVEVLNRGAVDTIRGKIVDLNTAYSIITIETSANDLKTFKYDNMLDIYLDKEPDGKLSDLREGRYVTLIIDKDILKRITINNTIEGEVESYNRTRGTIAIKHDGGLVTYEIDNNTTIEIFNISRPEISDLKRGMSIIAHLDGNRIKRVQTKSSFASIVTSVNTSWDRIEVQDPNDTREVLRYYIYSDTEIEIDGISKAKLENVNVNDAVELSFIGYDLESMKVIPPVYGNVTSVNTATNRLYVRGIDRNLDIVLNNDVEIYSTTGNRISAGVVKGDDFVKVITIGDKTRIYLAAVNEVEFFDTLGSRIYYYDSSRSYKNQVVDGKVQVWKGSTYYLIGDIAKGSTIVLYTFNDQILGIKIK